MSNLVLNALKHMADGPIRRVNIRARDAGRRSRVEVEDTDPGIPDGWQAKIFEAYVRGPHQQEPGLGLGLVTVRWLAQAYGSAINVESIAGTGSTFWFELPTAKAGIQPQ